jgi:hypothetical protein
MTYRAIRGRTRSATCAARLLGLLLAASALPAQTANFHFNSICRTDPATKKNAVTVSLNDEAFNPLPDVTINVLWTFVDYRQNRAVFRYKVASCSTDASGACTFSGGSGRARWQLSEVVGYDLGSPTFDTQPTDLCPNTLMIDFW